MVLCKNVTKSWVGGAEAKHDEQSCDTDVTIPFLALSLKGVSYQRCQESYAKGHSKGTFCEKKYSYVIHNKLRNDKYCDIYKFWVW